MLHSQKARTESSTV